MMCARREQELSSTHAGIGLILQADPGGCVPTFTSRAGICMLGRPSRYLIVWFVPTNESGCSCRHASVRSCVLGHTLYRYLR